MVVYTLCYWWYIILEERFCKNNLFIGKKNVVEIILKAVNDSSDVLCFDLHLINVFKKSTKTDVMSRLTLYCLSVTVEDLNRYGNIHILGTHYFVLLDSTLVRSVYLTFSVL